MTQNQLSNQLTQRLKALWFKKKEFEDINGSKGTRLKPSIKDPPTLEVKELPAHLEYAFFVGEFKIADDCGLKPTSGLEGEIVKGPRTTQKAIAWKIFEIIVINPSFYIHKILTKENLKPIVQPQRRLNPHMKEVVRTEVIKLLDARVIYPIFDSSQVSPVQVVPRKG